MPGREVDAGAPPAVELAVLGLDERARPDQAHLALQDVPELRQLVEARVAQEAADPGDPRVVVELQPVRVLALREQLRPALPRRRRTIVRNLAAGSACPRGRSRSWRKRTGPRRVELDRDRDARAAAARSATSSSAAPGDVDRPLEQARGARQDRRVEPEHGDALDVVDLDRRAERVEELGQQADLDAAARGSGAAGRAARPRRSPRGRRRSARPRARPPARRGRARRAARAPAGPAAGRRPGAREQPDRLEPVLRVRARSCGPATAIAGAVADEQHALGPEQRDAAIRRASARGRRPRRSRRPAKTREVAEVDAARREQPVVEPEQQRADQQRVEDPRQVVDASRG